MWGDFLLWFSLTLSSGFQGAGGDTRELLGRWSEISRLWSESWWRGVLDLLRWWSKNFFNRSPITLKFGAEKLERESQERESESESEREQVVVFRLVSCCCSTLVSCYSILVNFVIFTCKL